MRFLLLWCLLGLGGGSPAFAAAELTSKEILAGRKLHVAKCAKCHKFYEPRDYSPADWQKWMDSMSRKSKLKPAQEQLLKQFLEEYRAGRIEKAR